MKQEWVCSQLEAELLQQHSAAKLVKLLIECRICVDVGDYPQSEACFVDIQDFLDHMDKP